MDNPDTDTESGSVGRSVAASRPKWFTPTRLLTIFCFANIMVYLDRGVIASNGVNGSPRTVDDPKGSGIQGQFGLTNAEDGLLASGFLIGLLIASPIFSEACKHYSAFRLIGIGMGTWALAVLGCGLSFNFGSIFACRVLVGVGEASFVALAAPFIDDYAPPALKARWFALFYLCIPAGFALGYVYGGVVAAGLGWRAAFYIVASVMAPFVAFMFISSPLHLHGTRDIGPDPARPKSLKSVVLEFCKDFYLVLRHPVWVNMVAGYTLYCAVLGVYAFWGPKAGRELYALAATEADLWFGGLTVVTGVVGALSGGFALDFLGATLQNANLVCAVAALGGLAFALLAFLVAKSFVAFMALFGCAELLMFMIQSPVGAIGMWSVPTILRPLAISMVTIFIHLCGDVPSPPLLGLLQTHLEAGKTPEAAAQQWRVSMSLISLLLAPSGLFFLWNARVSIKAKDYRDKEELVLAQERDHAHLHRSGGGASGGGVAAAAAPAGQAGDGGAGGVLSVLAVGAVAGLAGRNGEDASSATEPLLADGDVDASPASSINADAKGALDCEAGPPGGSKAK